MLCPPSHYADTRTAFVFRDTTMAALKAQIEGLQSADDIVNTPSPNCGCGSKNALVDQNGLAEELQKKVDRMTTKLAMYERHYNIAMVDADRLKSKQTIAGLILQRQNDRDEISRLHGAIRYKQSEIIATQVSRRELNDLQNQLDAKIKRIEELEPAILQHDRDMYKRDAQVAKFDAFNEHMHIMVEAGGLQMLLTVLFLGALKADAGIDLAELGIDTERSQSYHEYGVAMADGRQSAIFPQGKWVGSTLLYFSASPEISKIMLGRRRGERRLLY
jgi:hypothetical protein